MIPTVDNLKSDALTHGPHDLFNPPGLTNFLGAIQVAQDITAIRSINFPPFCGSDYLTAGFYIDDIYFPALGIPITYIWYPDRIVRRVVTKALSLESITAIVPDKRAIIIRLKLTNQSQNELTRKLTFRLQGGVTKSLDKWADFMPPHEDDNIVEQDQSRQALVFSARHSRAYLIQGLSDRKAVVDRSGCKLQIKLKSKEIRQVDFIYVIGENLQELQADYKLLAAKTSEMLAGTRRFWNEELKAVFTPGNDRYSGSLPVLQTDDKKILKLYHIGILGVIYFKRDNPFSIYGRAYDTLMPRYWQTVTFLWDYSLSSITHALLDPAVMRKYLEFWMGMDIHNHFGSDYLTGGPVGPWYSVNDYAMVWMANDYLRWSGDKSWLDKTVKGQTGTKSILDYLDEYASNWKNFKLSNGLADYGGINNLLECVRTYIHQVASLNAGNVFNLRTLGGIHAVRGDTQKAADRFSTATDLLQHVQELYISGAGHWNTGMPDGSKVPVRHCYDFITILNTIADDLSPAQKSEMAQYFFNELHTPRWMRALSPKDPDTIFSIRPDHQWNGAYPAWPAQSVTGLYKLGEVDRAFEWLHGLAQSANQGPFGQAHFTDEAAPLEAGGALKPPFEMPYLTDWTVSSGGSWVNIIIESIFGVKATIYNGISARPQFGPFDPKAELHDLVYQGRRYNVDRNGLKSVDQGTE